MVVGRKDCYIVELNKILYLKKRLSHLYPDGLRLVTARHYTAVVVTEYNDGTTVERWVEYPLTRNEEIVAVAESEHLFGIIFP
jgi:hypothetical protein